ARGRRGGYTAVFLADARAAGPAETGTVRRGALPGRGAARTARLLRSQRPGAHDGADPRSPITCQGPVRMTVFVLYSRYYVLLYRDKDYGAESDYLRSVLALHAPGARQLLDLGCGTGSHALALAARGFDVVGVDISEGMIARAQQRPKPATGSTAFRLG